MIHPEQRIKTYWDFSVLITSLFGALIVPLTIVFDIRSLPLAALARWLLPVIFALDIVVHFNTALLAPGRIIENRKEIAQKYLEGWFWIDLAAALPIGLILMDPAIPDRLFLHLLQLNIILKLPRSVPIMRRIAGANANPAIFRLFLLVFWILLSAHFVSCGWILVFGNPEGLDPLDHYIKAFYWTVTTLTTIGYGDIVPHENIEFVFVVLIELLGAGMYGLVIGNIANLIANIDVAKTQYREKLDKINTFLKYRNIPLPLQKKINDYYSYLWESRRGYDESSVLRDLPDPLMVTVSLFLNKGIIEKVPLFQKAGEDLIKDIIMNLTPVVFSPGDCIVTAGEVGFDMYFISKGAVDVLSADESTHYATLTSGHFFGEIALLLSTPRTATIKAREYCDLYRLDKEAFDQVLTRYPDFAAKMQELAEKRRAELNGAQGAVDGTGEPDKPSAAPDKAAAPGKAAGTWSGGSITLQWDELKGADHYELIKRVPETGKWRFLTRRLQETRFTDEEPGIVRANHYRIRTVSGSAPGPWSETVIVENKG